MRPVRTQTGTNSDQYELIPVRTHTGTESLHETGMKVTEVIT